MARGNGGNTTTRRTRCGLGLCCLPCLCACALLAGVYLAVREVLRESLRLPGARIRMVGRLASWTKDAGSEEIPELALNRLLVAEVFLQMLASGLGAVALVWATVVLLGGFSSMLVRMDFWFTTAIVFVETARIVGYNSAPEAKFFVDVPAASYSRKILHVESATDFVGLITMGPALIALTPIFAASACMTLSTWRLLGIARQGGYGDFSVQTSNGNVKPALILFYALVLTQGALFIMWLVVAMSRSAQAKSLSKSYFRDEKEKMTNRYIASTLDTCVEKGVVNTMNRTLVTFAAELLQSEQSDDDHKIAVSVLHVVIGREERRAGAIQQIRSSEQLVGRLVRLLSSESAVLDACLVKAVAQTSHDTGETRVSIKSDTKEIIVRSLQILCKLADDPEICTEMCNSKVLVSKIMASLTPSLHIAIADEAATVEAVRASLDVLDKLTSRTGACSTKICRTISGNIRTVGNILWILSNSTHTDMKTLAAKILTRLTLGRIGCPDIQQLVIMLSDDGASKEHRTVMAQLLAQFCANCRTDEDRDRLRPIISTALSTVLKTMCDTQCTNDDADSWKLLGSYLGLTKHICVNLAITADAFAAAVKGIPEGDHVFVTKLKEIVDTCMDRFSRNSCVDSDDDCLVIMKSAAKLATWMMKTNRDYIKYFCQVNILEKLEAATVAMANLEKYMLLTGGFPDESELHGETLSSLMESVKDSVSQQQA